MSKGGSILDQVLPNVWDALDDSPAEAANMRMRIVLMISHLAGRLAMIRVPAVAAGPCRLPAIPCRGGATCFGWMMLLCERGRFRRIPASVPSQWVRHILRRGDDRRGHPRASCSMKERKTAFIRV